MSETGTPRFAPVSRRGVSEQVRDLLAKSIAEGELLPGSQLPSERELCEAFGVARTSVREAVQGLVSLGVIEKRGNRSYVAEQLPEVSFDGDDQRKRRVTELFEVRQAIELPIARLAACRATDEQRQELVEIASGFRPDMPLKEFRQLDRQFHWAVARACGNATLAELYGKVLDSLFQSSEFDELLGSNTNQAAVRDVIEASGNAHRQIAAALQAGDWAAAVQEVEGHLDQVETLMVSNMV